MTQSYLKILMIVLSTVAPDVRVEKEARFLAKEGNDVTVLAINQNDSLPFEEARDGYKIVRFSSRKKLFFKYFEFWKNVKRYINGKEFDIIHFHDLNVLPLASKLKKHAKVLVYDSHELFPELMSETYGFLAYFVFTLLERYYLRFVTGIITVGRPSSEHFKKKYKRDTITIRNYPSLIDVNKAKEIPIPSEYAKRKRFRVVSFGVMYHNMGYDKIVLAAEILKEVISPEEIEFLIIGSGEAYTKMLELIKNKKLESYFHLTGWMDYKLALSVMRTCDVGLILCQPSKNNYARMPNRLYEYCAAGVPFIGADFPGLREGSKYPKEFGILIDATSPKAIADAIVELYNDPEKAKNMKEAALEAFETKFNWEKEVQKLLDLYNELLKSGN